MLTSSVLENLSELMEELTPEVRKAASYVLENPNNIGVSSIRELADAANVKPNTLVRLARSLGYEGYEDFREPFRDEVRRGGINFPDRARWLQTLGRGGSLDSLYAEMAMSAIENIERSFASTNAKVMKSAAEAIVKARKVFVLGVGVNNTNARNFTYLLNMSLNKGETIPRVGNSALDDLAHANQDDVLIAMTCKPYRSEAVDGVMEARELGMTIVAISDSRASPIVLAADHAFLLDADTPQFFPSSVSIIALLETLMAFVIAEADEEVVANIDKFHARRHAKGIYVEDQTQKGSDDG